MAQKLMVITGPTASGKTALGIALAKKTGGEIVSADSMQLYRGMDIGTAKPTLEERGGVPHYMIDVAEPVESYSVARYVEEATACLDDILSRGKLPIIVGGTGLYIDALVAGRDFSERGDETLRGELSDRYDAEGGLVLWQELMAVDPLAAEKLHHNDKRRIIRALEIFKLTGTTISAHDEQTRRSPPRYDACTLVLSYHDRSRLYAKIDRRVEHMLAQGLLEEVRALLRNGLTPGNTALQAIGYKELTGVLLGGAPLEVAVDAIKQESRRYAKRQLSWFRRNQEAHWLLWDNEPDFDIGLQNSTEYLEKFVYNEAV